MKISYILYRYFISGIIDQTNPFNTEVILKFKLDAIQNIRKIENYYKEGLCEFGYDQVSILNYKLWETFESSDDKYAPANYIEEVK